MIALSLYNTQFLFKFSHVILFYLSIYFNFIFTILFIYMMPIIYYLNLSHFAHLIPRENSHYLLLSLERSQ